MAKREVVVRQRLGLHSRVAMQVADFASVFERTEVTLRYGEYTVPTKSVMNLLKVAAAQGATVELHGEGPEAEVVMDEIEKILSDEGEG